MAGSIKIGVVGQGKGSHHLIGYGTHPNARVTALCDQDPERLSAVSMATPMPPLDAAGDTACLWR